MHNMGIILEQVIPFYEAREEAMKYIRLKEDKEGCEVKSVDKIIGKLFILSIKINFQNKLKYL